MARDVVGDGLGMLLAVLCDVVRDLTWLIMIDGDLHIRCASALLPWLLVVPPFLCRIQQKADDVG